MCKFQIWKKRNIDNQMIVGFFKVGVQYYESAGLEVRSNILFGTILVCLYFKIISSVVLQITCVLSLIKMLSEIA